MKAPFEYSADTLGDFFSLPGRGFYVPHYQRSYSWTDENAEKLVADITVALHRALEKPKHALFLGTVILHDEIRPQVGIHFDTQNLLSKLSNVVDGQQRITSLAVLACALSEDAQRLIELLAASTDARLENRRLELLEEQSQLLEFFSFETRKQGANPKRKPLIIRAGDVSANPASDQWTLAGATASFYQSGSAALLSEMIKQGRLLRQPEGLLGEVLCTFREKLKSWCEGETGSDIESLLGANQDDTSVFKAFLSAPPTVEAVRALSQSDQELVTQAMRLQALSRYLRNGCHLMVINAPDEASAFDMFQALNATGTPLTAFEVFKPNLVRKWRDRYATDIKPEVDLIMSVLDAELDSDRKQASTHHLVSSCALVYRGAEVSASFSEERNWLVDALENAKTDTVALDFLRCLADQARYYGDVVRPKKPKRDAAQFDFVMRLQNLGLSIEKAELAAFCVYFIRDAKHRMAHSVLSVFYARLLRAQGPGCEAAVAFAADEFCAVAKAVAAFFTLWMGGNARGFPDAVYKQMFVDSPNSLSVLFNGATATAATVRLALTSALEDKKIYCANDVARSRVLWVEKAANAAWYPRQAVCRFALFISFHDAAADLAPGRLGLHASGRVDSAPMRNAKAWYSSAYEVIEHVAVQDKPDIIDFPNYFDPLLYPGNTSVVDRIGNLTLLSRQANSSIYSEWPEKVYFYWSLTTPSASSSPIGEAKLMTCLGITRWPPALTRLSAAAQHLPHLAPLVVRGAEGQAKLWNKDFVERRSTNLCERIFDVLVAWL